MSKNDYQALFQYINKAASRVSKEVSGDKPIVTGTILASIPGKYRVQIANSNENTPVDAVVLNSNDTFKKDDYVYLLKSEVASGDLFEFKYFIFGLVDETKEEFYNLTDWERFSKNDNIKFFKQDQFDYANTSNPFNWYRIEPSEPVISEIKNKKTFSISANFSYSGEPLNYGVGLIFYKNTFSPPYQSIEVANYKLDINYFTGQPFNLSNAFQSRVVQLKDNEVDFDYIQTYIFKEGNGTVTLSNFEVAAGSLLEVEGKLNAEISVQDEKNYFTKDGASDEVTIAAAAKYNNQILSSDDIQYYWFIKFNESDLEKIIENWKLDQKNKTGIEPTEEEVSIYRTALMYEYDIRTNIDFLDIHTGDGWVCLNSYDKVYALDGEDAVEVVVWNKKSNSITFNKSNVEVMKYFTKFSNSLKCIIKYLNNQIETDEIEILNFENEELSYQINFTGSVQSLLSTESILTIECKEVSPNPNAKVNQGYYGYEWYIGADKDASIDNWTPISFEGDSKPSEIIFNQIKVKDSFQDIVTEPFTWNESYRVIELNSNTEYLICKVIIYKDSLKEEEKYSEFSNILKLKSYVWSGVTQAKRAYKYYISHNRGVIFENFNILPQDFKIIDSSNSEANWLIPKKDDQELFNLEGLQFLNTKSLEPQSEPLLGEYLYYTYQDQWEEIEDDGTIIPLEKSDWSNPIMYRGVDEGGNELLESEIEQINIFNDLTKGGSQEGIFLDDIYIKYSLSEDEIGKTSEEIDKYLYTYNFNSDVYERVSNDTVLEENIEYYELKENQLYINATHVQAETLSVISARMGNLAAGSIKSLDYAVGEKDKFQKGLIETTTSWTRTLEEDSFYFTNTAEIKIEISLPENCSQENLKWNYLKVNNVYYRAANIGTEIGNFQSDFSLLDEEKNSITGCNISIDDENKKIIITIDEEALKIEFSKKFEKSTSLEAKFAFGYEFSYKEEGVAQGGLISLIQDPFIIFPNFYINKNGDLQATNIFASGQILLSNNSDVAGFKVQGSFLTSDSFTLNSNPYISANGEDIFSLWIGAKKSENDAPFKVTNDGRAFIQAGEIGGNNFSQNYFVLRTSLNISRENGDEKISTIINNSTDDLSGGQIAVIKKDLTDSSDSGIVNNALKTGSSAFSLLNYNKLLIQSKRIPITGTNEYTTSKIEIGIDENNILQLGHKKYTHTSSQNLQDINFVLGDCNLIGNWTLNEKFIPYVYKSGYSVKNLIIEDDNRIRIDTPPYPEGMTIVNNKLRIASPYFSEDWNTSSENSSSSLGSFLIFEPRKYYNNFSYFICKSIDTTNKICYFEISFINSTGAQIRDFTFNYYIIVTKKAIGYKDFP